MGEKGRAQLVRVERDRILGTMNDVNKMRITFAQVGVFTYVAALLPAFMHCQRRALPCHAIDVLSTACHPDITASMMIVMSGGLQTVHNL